MVPAAVLLVRAEGKPSPIQCSSLAQPCASQLRAVSGSDGRRARTACRSRLHSHLSEVEVEEVEVEVEVEAEVRERESS